MELKPFASLNQQVDKLLERGCIIEDRAEAIDILSRINYYRLCAYFLPFKDENGQYRTGTNISTVYQIYEFDRKLRTLLFGMLEQLEISLRAKLSYFHSQKYGPSGYLDETLYNRKHNHQRLLDLLETIKRKHYNSSLVVKHHVDNYGGSFPIWVLTDFFTFGELSCFYSDMKTHDKKAFARATFSVSYIELESWLMCMTDLRNFCAHYSRLYYYLFARRPATPKDYFSTSGRQWGRRIFDYILIMKQLCYNMNSWDTTFLEGLKGLMEEYENSIELNHIGFPNDWLELLE